jgi:hypothetical protein
MGGGELEGEGSATCAGGWRFSCRDFAVCLPARAFFGLIWFDLV